MPAAHTTYGKITKRHRNQTRQQRGYTEQWYRFRRNALANPEDYDLPATFAFCHDCMSRGYGDLVGRLTPTVDIHHKIHMSVRPDLQYVPSNLVGLCKSCHAKRTARGQ